MFCSHCQVQIDNSENSYCSNCGYSLLQESLLQENLFQEEKAEQDTPLDNISHNNIIVSLHQEIELIVKQEQVISIRIYNNSMEEFSQLTILLHAWEQALPFTREVEKCLPPMSQIFVALPVQIDKPGQILITSLTVQAKPTHRNQKITFHAKEDIIINAVLPESSSKINQITLQDYAQLLGDLVIEEKQPQWKTFTLHQLHDLAKKNDSIFPPHPLFYDYCCLDISSPSHNGYIYICSKPEVWLGRSAEAEFQTLLFPKNSHKNLQMSSKQAKIIYRDDKWFLEDNQSANGTWINSNRLETGKPHIIKHEDTITFAKSLSLQTVIYQDKEKELPQALKIHYPFKGSNDIFLVLVKKALVSSSSNAPISIPSLPVKKWGYIIYAQGYFWHNLIDEPLSYHNKKPLTKGAIVPLCLGDTLRIKEVQISICPE